MQSDATRQRELGTERSDACARPAGREALGKGAGDTLPATTASPEPPRAPQIPSHPQPQTLQPSLALGQQIDLSSCAGSPGVLQLSHFWHEQEQQQGEAGPVSTAIAVLLNCCFPFPRRQKNNYFTKQADLCFHRRAGGSRTQEYLCLWQRVNEQP